MSPEFDDDHVAAICRVLIDCDVRFVVIDICPATGEDNLVNLATALRQLGAKLRVEGDPSGVAFDPIPMCCVW